MINFDWWWTILLLPLPMIARRWLPAVKRSGEALAVPLLQRHNTPLAGEGRFQQRLARTSVWLLWICLVVAVSRPYWLGDPVSRLSSGRDLMLAVDISGSMSELDMTIDGRSASRIDALKIVVGEFIERRAGDRLGLILFGTNAYSYVPLTYDLATLRALLMDVSSGLAGRHTAIGDAIGLAVKSMREQEAQHKVLVLVTDGSNTAGFDDPVVTALAARQQGLTIHTIGVGSDEESLSQIYGAQNVPAGTAMNEPVLKQIASLTGGQYFRATDAASLEQIYVALDELEPVAHDHQPHRPRSEMYPFLLALGLLSLLVFLSISIYASWKSRT